MTPWILLFLALSFLTTVALLGALVLSKRAIHQSPVVDEESITMPTQEMLPARRGPQLGIDNFNH